MFSIPTKNLHECCNLKHSHKQKSHWERSMPFNPNSKLMKTKRHFVSMYFKTLMKVLSIIPWMISRTRPLFSSFLINHSTGSSCGCFPISSFSFLETTNAISKLARIFQSCRDFLLSSMAHLTKNFQFLCVYLWH